MIDPLPDPPQPGDSIPDFQRKAAAHVLALQVWTNQVNDVAAQVGNTLNGTSATSLTIGLGSKALVTQVNKAFAPGQTINVARTSDPATAMTGLITSANPATGSITFSSNDFAGPVGPFTDWTISVAGLKGSQLAGFRNLVINGNFAVNQRAYASGAATTAANQFTLDRWRVVTSGQSLAFAASGNGSQVTAPAGGIEQVIEALNVGGGTYVASWVGTAVLTVNGTACAKGATFNLPANTNATVRLSAGTVAQFQLELAAVPSPFEQRPIQVERDLCKRYYEQFNNANAYAYAMGMVPNNNQAWAYFGYAEKRATPTVICPGNVENFQFQLGSGTASCTTRPFASNAGTKGCFFILPSTSAGLNTDSKAVLCLLSGNAVIEIGAEL